MRNMPWVFAFGTALAFGGCVSRPPAVKEIRSPSGLPLRIELGEEEERDTIDAESLKQRMVEYRSTAATQPTRILSPLFHARGTTTGTFDPFVARNCPPQGNARSQHNQGQDRLKNRITEPEPADIDLSVTLEDFMRPGNDVTRFSNNRAVTIVAYLRSAQGTGAESCNCDVSDESLTDTHMNLVAGPLDARKPVIAEITPVWRLIHQHDGLEDWSSQAIIAKYEGKKVRITGWLFFDDFHIDEADNTDPGDHKGKKNWRRTCWEVHPVTSIELAQ